MSKEGIITSAIKNYMNLSKDKKMYILGFMQGTLMQRDECHKNPRRFRQQDVKKKGE